MISRVPSPSQSERIGAAKIPSCGGRERHDAGRRLHRPAGSARAVGAPHVDLAGRGRGDDPEIAVVVEVADGDVDRDRLVAGIHPGPPARLLDLGRVGAHREARQLAARRGVDRVHEAVGVAEDHLQVAEAGEVDERGLALAAG